MTFRWTRTPGHVTATCDACGTQITHRTEGALLRDQRGHDLAVCIERQRAARVAVMADTDESPTAATVYVYKAGQMTIKKVRS
jgi:hypothetical protein